MFLHSFDLPPFSFNNVYLYNECSAISPIQHGRLPLCHVVHTHTNVFRCPPTTQQQAIARR